ncbi:MAG: zinc ribbon domain-containing protein [Blastocatellia bacterium]|nr:zinc ribbon domain-containing protein [Blastocatellia bacterium]
MFCPNCGTPPLSDDQKFCKVCGTNLLVVSQVLNPAVSGQNPYAPLSQPAGMPLPAAPPGPGMVPSGPPAPPSAPLPGIPFLDDAVKREKLRRLGWMMMGGGIVFGILMGVLGDALRHIIGPLGRAIGELGGLGALVTVAGFFVWFYAKVLIKKPDLPQVIVVQQPTVISGQTGNLPYQGQPVQAQLPPPAVSSYGPPFSVTEHTTHRLEMPYQPTSRDTK